MDKRHVFLKELGIDDSNSGVCVGGEWLSCSGRELISVDPTTDTVIAKVQKAGLKEYDLAAAAAQSAFLAWRSVPAPKRGWVARDLAEEFRKYKKLFGRLISVEMGKILPEGEGEVQEVIDICEKSQGMARELPGMVVKSEREDHFMFEQWHPLGVVGIIDAFNFPMAVRFWNAALAAVCGDSMIFKPSLKTPLCAIATQHICNRVMKRAVRDYGFPSETTGIFNLLIGADDIVGSQLVNDPRIKLISATGSTYMGKAIAPQIASRLGRYLLELGGNNAVIVLDDADLKLAVRAIVFGSVGTAGQRCTTTRRLIMQKGIKQTLTDLLLKAYSQLSIGDPLSPKTLVGPLIDGQAVQNMGRALETAKLQGGRVIYGGERLNRQGYFVSPALVEAYKDMSIVKEETFAPILYLLEASDLAEAIKIHNDVPQGLSSAIFTRNIKSAFEFLSERGSDCGIANANIGTSGAEIGLAFGGEKDTGGGREAGSDAWKAYMRRQTCTINWSSELPLAQGIKFGD